jgi:hypothetical protein
MFTGSYRLAGAEGMRGFSDLAGNAGIAGISNWPGWRKAPGQTAVFP